MHRILPANLSHYLIFDNGFYALSGPDEDYLLQLTKKLEEIVIAQNKSWQRCRDIHISLSKTFTLPYHLITPFTHNLQKAVTVTKR